MRKRHQRAAVANTPQGRSEREARHPNNPNATRTDQAAIGTRQAPHGVSQERSSNAMVAHPTEVGGTVPTSSRVPPNPDNPKTA